MSPREPDWRRSWKSLGRSERRQILVDIGAGRPATRRADASLAAEVAKRWWKRNVWILLLLFLSRGVLMVFAVSGEGTLASAWKSYAESPGEWGSELVVLGLVVFFAGRARRAELANRELVGEERAPAV